MRMMQVTQQRISSIYEAEQHVYAIPSAGTMPSPAWASLTNERRVSIRMRAISIWKDYIENDGRVVPHSQIFVPEYRQMLSHPDGQLIVEEI